MESTNARPDYFNLPDGPGCRKCDEPIVEFPHVTPGKLACLGGNANICRECCRCENCVTSRREAAL